MNRTRLQGFVWLLLASALVVGFQNCSGCERGPSFSSSTAQMASSGGGGGSGSGEPYDGKPDPGTYYRVIPGYRCAGRSNVFAKIEVKADSAVRTRYAVSDCGETKDEIAFSALQTSPVSKALLGFEEGIYQFQERTPDVESKEAPWSETWCSSEAINGTSMHVNVQSRLDQGTWELSYAEMRTDLSGSPIVQTSPPQIVSREQLGSKLAYRSSTTSLDVDLLLPAPSNTGRYQGRLTLNVGGQSKQLSISCRTAFSLDTSAPLVTTLSLDFSRNSLPASVQFARSVSATYIDASGVLRTAPAGQPRFGVELGSQERQGILIEPAATNFIPESTDVRKSPWWTYHAQITQDGTLAPDGVSQAMKIIESNEPNEYHGASVQVAELADNTDYCFSAFAKKGTRNVGLKARYKNGPYAECFFDLDNGKVIKCTGLNAGIQPMAGGWYRLFISWNTKSGASIPELQAHLAVGDVTLYTGDGASMSYVWGMQVERGQVPTSYIPTSGGMATRTADSVEVEDLSWFASNQGTFYAETVRPFNEAAGTEARAPVFSIESASGGQISVMYDATSGMTGRVRSDAGDDESWSWNDPSAGLSVVLNRIGLSYVSGGGMLFLNDLSVAAPSRVATGMAANRFRLGGNGSSDAFNGFLRRLDYWPRTMDAQALKDRTR